MSLYGIINAVFLLFEILIILRVALSWVPHERNRSPFTLLYLVTDPVILPCRELLVAVARAFRYDLRALPVDFSPVVALLLFDFFLRRIVLYLCYLILK